MLSFLKQSFRIVGKGEDPKIHSKKKVINCNPTFFLVYFSHFIAKTSGNFIRREISGFSSSMEQALDEKMEKKQENYQNKKKMQKYNGKVKKRQWEFDDTDSPNKKASKDFEPSDRVKRKKSVVLLGYSGVNYFGMQKNPGMKTIEDDLLNAMLKNDWITEEVFQQPQLIQFQRAARTDKGVSAAQQIVSLKLPETIDIDKINSCLPEQIKIFAVKRVTKSFNSKSSCDARTYSYTLPTVAFSDKTENPEDMPDDTTFRLSSEKVDQVNEILKTFEGTKNFHNFTSRK